MNLNGQENYITYAYEETDEQDTVTTTNAKEEKITRISDKTGKVLQVKYGDTLILNYTYNAREQVSSITDYETGITHNFEYDKLCRIILETKYRQQRSSRLDELNNNEKEEKNFFLFFIL